MNETFSDLDTIIQLSKDTDTLGFDLKAGTTWIYPTNYPIRDYQFNITQTALHQNTLVSLPTGLGKTFIAAVVMYNFYRWYPMGKIIFMAPTKPLVTQQMEACYSIMAIPKNVSIEMTGTKITTSRAKIWKEKRVFYITPHILQNDIDSVLELAPQIRCIIIDEAHKALGKNANCEAIKKIQNINNNFRVLALSATPGSNFNSIKDVVSNLLISHIEVRTNESVDVAPYVFQRKLDKYVIPITGKLLAIRCEYIKILDRYTRPLLQHNIITGNCANLTKGRLVLTMKEFKEKGRHHSQYGFILKNLNICITIYHGYELLIRHGLRAFLQFFKENISKPLINAIVELHAIIDDIDGYLGPLDNVEMLPDGTIPEITGNLVYSHPKFEKLSQVLISHFNQLKDGDTRVMVFCEYRESVMEIYTLLLRHRPLIKPRIFLGQGAISQAQQLQAVKMFKSGQCNTLVSTCIGEEGLDVGEVDLIVCFDINSKSPIRIVQRMGRTGRKRDGRVVILVTEGKEEQLLTECLVQRNNMNSLLESNQIKNHLYKNNPKMIPNNIIPECNKMFITACEPEKPPVKKKPERKNTKKSSTNNNKLKNMLENMSSSQSSIRNSPSKTFSKKSTPPKKQADLRSMFSKIASNSQNSALSEVITIQDEEDLQSSEELKELISNIKKYLDTSLVSQGCKICNNLFDCNSIINNNVPVKQNFNWEFNASVFDQVTAESLKMFSQSLQYSKSESIKSCSDDLEKTFDFFKINSTFDIYSDNSDENNTFIVNPAIFNQSSGFFNSKIPETQNQNIFAPSPSDLFGSSDDEMLQNQAIDCVINKTPVKDNDLIVGSSSEKKLSPVFNKSRSRKFRIQRRLFSQASSMNSNISKDFKQLESSTEQNTVASTPKKTTKFSFIPKETSQKTSNIIEPCTTQVTKNTTSFDANVTLLSKEPSATITSNVEHNTDFWDQSLFEICDSDEDFVSVSQKVLETKTNQDNIDSDDLFKNIDTPQEIKDNINDSFDSDATIILSFNTDEIFDNLEKEKIQNEPEQIANTSNVIKKSQLKSNETDNDQSLLSVTQMIDLLNNTEHDKPVNEIDINIPVNQVKTTDNDDLNKTRPSNTINNNKSDNCGLSTSKTDDIIIIDDFEKNSDNEQSLLSFSQNIKRYINIEKPLQNILKVNNDNSSSQITFGNRNKKLKLQLSTKKNVPTSCTEVSEPVKIAQTQNSPLKMTQTQDSPLKITKKNLNSKKAIILSDSDDDFEIKPKRKEPFVNKKATPEKKFKRIKSVSDIKSVLSTKNVQRTRSQSYAATNSKNFKETKKPAVCDFIEFEADVLIDEHYEADSEHEDDTNKLDSSFIHDTQSVMDQTDMYPKYLQSIRSPKKLNPFRMPALPTNINIFSQPVDNEDNTYMADSFCVDNDTTLSQRHGLSYLEMVEVQLEKKVRNEKKRKRLQRASEDSD